MAAKFELKKAANGQFMFNLKADNGEVMLTSETYVAKAAAKESIASVRADALHDARYARRIATNGQRYFVLKALNGWVLGTSETYSSAQAIEDGIAAVKRDATNAPLEELT
jgi:uncharacterized protein